METTIVLIKPDGVKRGIIGEIISRFEKMGLKIAAMKMVWVEKDLVAEHYSNKEDFLRGMGEKTLKTYEQYGKDAMEELGTDDPLEIGKMLRNWNIDFIASGPVVAMLLEGNHAVDNVRMLVGDTIPTFAVPGTIRGDYSVDSPVLANAKKRTIRNIVHASGNIEEAEFEKKLWFKESEIYSYKRADETTMFE